MYYCGMPMQVQLSKMEHWVGKALPIWVNVNFSNHTIHVYCCKNESCPARA